MLDNNYLQIHGIQISNSVSEYGVINLGNWIQNVSYFQTSDFLSTPLFGKSDWHRLSDPPVFFRRGQWSPSFVRQQEAHSLFSGRTEASKMRTSQDTSKGPEPFSKVRGSSAAPFHPATPSLASRTALWTPSSSTVFWFWRKLISGTLNNLNPSQYWHETQTTEKIFVIQGPVSRFPPDFELRRFPLITGWAGGTLPPVLGHLAHKCWD